MLSLVAASFDLHKNDNVQAIIKEFSGGENISEEKPIPFTIPPPP